MLYRIPGRVNLHELDVRPIAKGRLGKPVEFGGKAQVTDNDDGVILDYAVEQGNPIPRFGFPSLRPGGQVRRWRR